MSDYIVGEAVEIVRVLDGGNQNQYELDSAALSKILVENGVGDKPVAIYSVAGDMRKGKSFLLNLMIRYLESGCSKSWLDTDLDRELTGFPWRGGSERTTTGILMWSKVYTVKVDKKEVALILMDTQGMFDHDSSVRDCATIFGLSLMLSSVTVFNLMHNIQENDLQHLNLFAEYGRLAHDGSGQTCFQKIMFLIRDWPHAHECDYGADGGKKFLKKKLEVLPHQKPELQELRKNLRACFDTMVCFLMPEPGKAVKRPNFHGELSDIEEDFIDNLKDLIPMLLSPNSLIIKYQGGHVVKARDLPDLLSTFVDVFKGNNLPEPKTLLDAMTKAAYSMSLEDAKELYLVEMQSYVDATQGSIPPDQLDMKHVEVVKSALDAFHQRKKLGRKEKGEEYLQQLNIWIKEKFETFQKANKVKRQAEEAAARERAEAEAREAELKKQKAKAENQMAKEREEHKKGMDDAARILREEKLAAEKERAAAAARQAKLVREKEATEEAAAKERRQHDQKLQDINKEVSSIKQEADRDRERAAAREEQLRRDKEAAEAKADRERRDGVEREERLMRVHREQEDRIAAMDKKMKDAEEEREMRHREKKEEDEKLATMGMITAIANTVGGLLGHLGGSKSSALPKLPKGPKP